MGIILKENNIIYTKMRHEKFLGSSKYRFDVVSNAVVLKEKLKPVIPLVKEKSENQDDLDYLEKNRTDFLRENNPAYAFVEPCEPLPRDYEPAVKLMKLNKKFVREKCSAFFGLKRSRAFLAFYTISFPMGFDDDSCMKVFNTFLTRLRTDFKFESYLWVAERQQNGTLHFHLLTNTWMPIRRVNYYMAKAIETQVNKHSIDVQFDVEKYNGVDVKPVTKNRKALNIYLTKYVSKNSLALHRRPFHCSRDISELFTAETFPHHHCNDFKHIADVLKKIVTTVVDGEFASVEYLATKQPNGKIFNPPDSWYWLRDFFNELIYENHHSKIKFKILK